MTHDLQDQEISIVLRTGEKITSTLHAFLASVERINLVLRVFPGARVVEVRAGQSEEPDEAERGPEETFIV